MIAAQGRTGGLLSAADMAAAARCRVPWDWLRPAHSALVRRLSDDDYPCYFGLEGQRSGANTFAYLDRREVDCVVRLGAALEAFQERAAAGRRRQSLLVFVGPPETGLNLDAYRRRFWLLLADLRSVDRSPWPARVPEDVDHPRWEWCFGGEPWFVFGCCPAYHRRRSRNLGPALVAVFQTKRVFDGIGGETPAGAAAKRTIRSRLLAYDGQGAHPALGEAAHSSVHKWTQYFLPDDNDTEPARPLPAVG